MNLCKSRFPACLGSHGRRGITHDEVLAALTQPVRTVPAHNDLLEAQGWIDRAGKRLLLRVIYKGAVVVSVITVMAARKFEKYGATP